MVRGAEPLVVNVLVATLARVGLHEELAGDFLSAVNLRGTGKEWPLGSIAFFVHRRWRICGVLDAGAIFPSRSAEIPRTKPENPEHNQDQRRARPNCRFAPCARDQESKTCGRENDVGIEPIPLRAQGAGF